MIYKIGNLFDSTADVLCHQVNLYGFMGGGIAAEVKERFPEVNNTYERFCDVDRVDRTELLGEVLIVEEETGNNQFIANCFCQNEYGVRGCLTNYEKMEDCFKSILNWMRMNNKKSVALPYKIGCGISGGDLEIVEPIIKKVFDVPGITVEIWKYNETI